MENKVSAFNKVLSWVIYSMILLFPIIFVPVVRDFVILSKYYFLIFGAFTLLAISFLKLLVTRKIDWVRNPLLQAVSLMLLANILSIVIMAPNKFAAIFSPQSGLISLITLVTFFIYATSAFYKSKISPILVIAVSGLLLSVVSLIILVEPFKNINLSVYWSFLKNPTFNTVGTYIDMLGFLIFALVGTSVYLSRIRFANHHFKGLKYFGPLMSIIIVFLSLAIIFNVYSLVQAITTQGARLILPPLSLSWYAAVEVLKHPMTAIFGVGVNNFSSLFTQVRTVNYNLSDLWQVSSFPTSISSILNILTEQGVLGLTAIMMVIIFAFKSLKKVQKEIQALFITAFVLFILFPPTIITYFIFFLSVALIVADIKSTEMTHEAYEIDFTKLMPIYIGTLVIIAISIGFPSFFIGRVFMSDFAYKNSIDGLAENNLQKLYDNQRLAVNYNNSNEEFHRSFAQTNLLLVNNVVSKGEKNLTDADRQTLSQAIQVAISESKNAVVLNPQKVTNWEGLAGVYKFVINIVQDAPQWTVSSYQQAIQVDPKNPTLRLDLGSIFYLYKNYDEAQSLFEQAVSLKSDWTNARYNLAWVYYQKKFYQSAYDQMNIVVSQLDPAKQGEDYKKATSDLGEFKKILDEELAKIQQQQQEAQEAQQSSSQLNLPTPPPAKVEPKIELPNNASPESTVK